MHSVCIHFHCDLHTVVYHKRNFVAAAEFLKFYCFFSGFFRIQLFFAELKKGCSVLNNFFTYRKKGFIFFQPASVCDHIQFQGFCYLFSCKFHFVSLLPFKCFADAVVMEEFTLCGKRLDLLQGCKHMSICLLRLQ